MISPVRQEIIKLLPRVSELAPEVRFGQLMANLSYMAVDVTVEAIWDMEDEELLDALRQLIIDLSSREAYLKQAGHDSEVTEPTTG